MNPVVLVWLSSLLGAALFFAAGALATRRRLLVGPAPLAMASRTPPSSPAIGSLPRLPTAPGPEPTEPSRQMTGVQTEVAQLQLRLASAEEQLRDRDAELHRFRRALDEVQRRGKEEATRWQAERAELHERASRLPRLEAEVEQRRQEGVRWRQELREAEGQLSRAPGPEMEKTLRQDLAVKGQLLAANEQRLARAEEENARLRQEASGTPGLREERDKLQAENAQLRARAFAGRPLNVAAPPLTAPPPTARGTGRGQLFQTFVEQVRRLADIRCAVVADEMGLVVASHGTLGDEVAAVGALLTRVGAKAIEVLPLRNLHRVTVEDDQRVWLTLRPLPTREGKDSDLALLALGVGPAPDPQLLGKLIDEGPRTILS